MKIHKLLACILLIATNAHLLARKKPTAQQQETPAVPTIPYLHYTQDRFGNLNIDIIPNESDSQALYKQLKKFLKAHRAKYPNKAFLLNIPHEFGAYNQAARQAGFKMQYADNDKTQWVFRNGSNIPYSSTANASAGVFIIREENNQKEVLLLKDYHKPYLGLPSGMVDQHELVLDAVVREVKEETNLEIKRNDLRLVAIHNNTHNKFYDKDHYEFYFITDDPGGTIKIDPKEQEHYFWIPVDHVLKVNTIQGYEVNKVIKKILGFMTCKTNDSFHIAIPKAEIGLGTLANEVVDLWKV